MLVVLQFEAFAGKVVGGVAGAVAIGRLKDVDGEDEGARDGHEGGEKQ